MCDQGFTKQFSVGKEEWHFTRMVCIYWHQLLSQAIITPGEEFVYEVMVSIGCHGKQCMHSRQL